MFLVTCVVEVAKCGPLANHLFLQLAFCCCRFGDLGLGIMMVLTVALTARLPLDVISYML